MSASTRTRAYSLVPLVASLVRSTPSTPRTATETTALALAFALALALALLSVESATGAARYASGSALGRSGNVA
jgi:hypothetical protein